MSGQAERDFWGSPDNQSMEGKFLQADDAMPSLHAPGRQDQENESRESDVRQAYEESRSRAEERESFDRAKPYRDEIAEKWDTSPGNVIESMVNLHRLMQADPQTAGDKLAEFYLRCPMIHDNKPFAPQAKEEPPAYLTESGKLEWEREQAVRNAWRDARKIKDEDAEFENSRLQRQQLKQVFPHLTYEQALNRLVDFDKKMRTDPIGTSARLKASYGVPATDTQVRELAHEQRVGELSRGIEQVAAEGHLPGFGTPEVDAEIAKCLNYMTAKGHRSGDPGRDLAFAHDFVVNKWLPYEHAQRQQQQAQQETVRRAKAASRSVSGGPSPGSSSRRSSGGSVEDAARAAYAEASGRV